jgi:hypothetical integral membrane protein (TIGR02206 family)
MKRYFAREFDGPPFKLFGLPHLVALALILAASVALLVVGQRFPASWRVPTRIALATLLVVQELCLHAWWLVTGQWTLQESLPFHLCSVAVWLSAAMLVTRSHMLYEFCYLLGIAGALQALITPDVGPYGFPHFRFFQCLVSHGAIVAAAVYMTAVEGFRPYPISILRIALVGNLYALVVFGINAALGSNYLYVARKPDTASLLDLLPRWPWYILHIEAIAAVMVGLLYLPFFIHDLLR